MIVDEEQTGHAFPFSASAGTSLALGRGAGECT